MDTQRQTKPEREREMDQCKCATETVFLLSSNKGGKRVEREMREGRDKREGKRVLCPTHVRNMSYDI